MYSGHYPSFLDLFSQITDVVTLQLFGTNTSAHVLKNTTKYERIIGGIGLLACASAYRLESLHHRNTSVAWVEYKIRPYRWVCRCCSAVGWAPPTMFLIYYLR
ncbi:hypothetical protein Desac_0431 [Desulfobacca acetoxidans DSM 11109]|uniref:Uncharacterized protein n=1 Tax=Desulfobacca acetoxidans (strain ATCC 700848 / DSM 11109 / ASRB2) TaxID=880072 RepID=F2NEX8_DESAR|nr:hypothetical protein Desac_0431 [Desulfobacca acetoxidans DSM 11109]